MKLLKLILSEHSTKANNSFFKWLSGASTDFFELFDDVESVDDFSENDVVAVEPWSVFERNKELRSVRIWTSISHGEQIWLVEMDVEVFIGECWPVD